VVNEQQHIGTSDLRYMAATNVEHPSGTLAGLTMWTQDDKNLGAIGGVLLEPASRRVRYFVVQEPAALLSRRRYLLAADTPAVLDATDSKLRVEAHANDLERFDPRSVLPVSDEDLVTAMFARPPAA
jgi:hypothetical protein